MVYKIKDGYFRNPLLNGNMRNMKCLCKSGKKVKKCCGIPRYIKKDIYKIFKEIVDTVKKAEKNA